MWTSRRPRRALIAALAVLVAGASLLAPAVARPMSTLSTASPAPAYLSGLGSLFRAESNKAWKGAKEWTPDSSTNPLNKPPGEHDPRTATWPGTCKAKAQQVTFVRTLTLPGRPVSADFDILPVLGTAFPNPFRSWSLHLNGAKIAGGDLAGGSWSSHPVTLGAGDLKKFTHGKNKVEVTVGRAKLPGGVKACNTSDADRLAVVFALAGAFTADLALYEQEAPVLYKKAGTTSALVTRLTLRNLGPSGAVKGGTFRADIIGTETVVMAGNQNPPLPGTVPVGPPFDTCTAAQNGSPVSWRVDCELTAVKKGDLGHLDLLIGRHFESLQFGEERSYLSWSVSHPANPNGENNARGVEVVWCGELATSEGCASAS